MYTIRPCFCSITIYTNQQNKVQHTKYAGNYSRIPHVGQKSRAKGTFSASTVRTRLPLVSHNCKWSTIYSIYYYLPI